MPTTLTVTADLMRALFDMKILLRYKSQPPEDGTYGWVKEGQQVGIDQGVVIEQNVGLYGGQYWPMVGGRRSSGLVAAGAFTYSYSALPGGLTVGRYCSISKGLRFIDSSHPLDLVTTSAITFRPNNPLFEDFATESIATFAARYRPTGKPYPTVGNDVWIGSNVTLSMDIKIGTGSVIASNSTVTKDVPPYSIVGGNPARLIKRRFDEVTIGRLLLGEWWNYNPSQIFESISEPIGNLLDRIEGGELTNYFFSSIDMWELAQRESDSGQK